MKKINFFINSYNKCFNLNKVGVTSNLIYVTGLSGSGKTTLAEELSEKYNARLFELDNLGGFFGKYKESKELIHNLTEKFLNLNLELKDIIKKEKYIDLKINCFKKYTYWTNKYIDYLIEYTKNKDEIFIFEGTQIFKCRKVENIKDDPLIVVGTSSFVSMLRRIKRQYKIDKEKNKPNFFKKHFWKLLNDSKRLHFKDFKELNKFLSSYKNCCH